VIKKGKMEDNKKNQTGKRGKAKRVNKKKKP
jgi:hypothetical protein